MEIHMHQVVHIPTFWMLIGVPGSGKSTWATQTEGPKVLSTDEYIENFARYVNKTYNEVFEEQYPAAEKNLYANLHFCLAVQGDIIWDQTNLTKKSRAKKLAQIPNEYYKVAYYFPIPEEEEWKRRINSRPGKLLSENTLLRMKNSLELPSLDEGFDEILTFGEE